jgi:hypothetical protein
MANPMRVVTVREAKPAKKQLMSKRIDMANMPGLLILPSASVKAK